MSPVQLNSVWEEYFPKVFGYFFRRLDNRQDVEDLTSKVMFSFLDAVVNKDIEHKNQYLWTIARHELGQFCRQKSTQANTLALPEEIQTSSEVTDFYSKAYQHKVSCLLECAKGALKKEEMDLVENIILEDQTSVQIAQKMDLKPATVRKQLSRALQKIRRQCLNLWNNYSL